MKKLLISLMAISVIGTTITSVVACSTPTRSVEFNYEGITINLATSTTPGIAVDNKNKDEMKTALAGGNNFIGTGKDLITTMSDVLNIFNKTHFQYTTKDINPDTPQFDQNKRNAFIAAEDGEYIDGLFFKDVEGYGSDISDFYKNRISPVNSLEGMYQAAPYVAQTNKDNFDFTSDVAKKFFDGYLGEEDHAYDSSFTDLKFESVNATEKNDSVISFKTTKDNSQIPPQDLNESKETYVEANNNKDLDKGKVGDNAQNPFGLAILESRPAPALAPEFTNVKIETKESIPTDYTFLTTTSTDPDELSSLSSLSLYETKTDDQKPKYSYTANTKLIDIEEVKPFDLSLTYDSNTRNGDSDKYNISVNVSGLYATYIPIVQTADPKDENGNNQYATWIFAGYQFNDKVFGTITDGKDHEFNTAGYGEWSNMKLTLKSINKV